MFYPQSRQAEKMWFSSLNNRINKCSILTLRTSDSELFPIYAWQFVKVYLSSRGNYFFMFSFEAFVVKYGFAKIKQLYCLMKLTENFSQKTLTGV